MANAQACRIGHDGKRSGWGPASRVRFAASRPCARPRFRPCALAPSALPPGGWVGVPSRPCGPLPAGLPPLQRRWGGRLSLVSGFLWGCAVVALSRVSGFVPVVSVALRSARCRVAPWAGAALGFSFRRSRRSLSGFVAVVRFSSFAAASRFSLSWGRRLPPRPGFCAVRPVAGGFAVSLPVCPCLPPCRSGLRRLLAA